MEIVRALGLKGGDKLVIELIDDHIVLLPQPEDWVKYFVGSMGGVYGSTVEEIDQYIAEQRSGYERDEWLEEFDDIIAMDEYAKNIVDQLLIFPSYTASGADLYNKIPGFGSAKAEAALKRLVDHGGVRELPAPQGVTAYKYRYRLVRDFAKRLQSDTVA